MGRREEKCVLCALLLTDGVCGGGKKEGKKKKVPHKSLAWQPMAESPSPSLAGK